MQSGFIAGVSTDDGVTFVPKLHLGNVSAPIACAASTSAASDGCWADANAAACSGAPFEALCASLGCAATDAGADAATDVEADADVDAGPTKSVSPSSSSCRCDVVGGARTAMPGLGGAIAVFGLLRRRRRGRGASS